MASSVGVGVIGAGNISDTYLENLTRFAGTEVLAIGDLVPEVARGKAAEYDVDVAVPSHISALAQFESGQSAQGIFSFDSALPRTLLEVNGTEATILFPDPNYFDGEIAIRRRDGKDWETVATTTAKAFRGTGVLDMARALREGRPHRVARSVGLSRSRHHDRYRRLG